MSTADTSPSIPIDSASEESFATLGVSPLLVAALEKHQRISVPTPIQSAAIPLILSGKDTYLQAETGSGKTLAYLLPLFTRMDPLSKDVQVIVIVPTHELALQILRQCTDLAQQSGIPIRSLLLIGGTPMDRQLDKLKKKPHLVVGSTGRIFELIQAGKLKVHKIQSIVLDEADRLLADESAASIARLIKAAPGLRQLIYASATQRHESREAISKFSPSLVMAKPSEALINQNIRHFYTVCEERDKPDLLRSALHAFRAERALIFVHRNETAEILAAKLAHHKVAVADLHGAYRKEDRKRAMDDFRAGKVRALIASDIAARGLDIKGVTHVVNYDVPSESKAYLHRVGRTARAGASGVAVSLLTAQQGRILERLEQELGITMTEFYLRNGEVQEVAQDDSPKST